MENPKESNLPASPPSLNDVQKKIDSLADPLLTEIINLIKINEKISKLEDKIKELENQIKALEDQRSLTQKPSSGIMAYFTRQPPPEIDESTKYQIAELKDILNNLSTEKTELQKHIDQMDIEPKFNQLKTILAIKEELMKENTDALLQQIAHDEPQPNSNNAPIEKINDEPPLSKKLLDFRNSLAEIESKHSKGEITADQALDNLQVLKSNFSENFSPEKIKEKTLQKQSEILEFNKQQLEQFAQIFLEQIKTLEQLIRIEALEKEKAKEQQEGLVIKQQTIESVDEIIPPTEENKNNLYYEAPAPVPTTNDDELSQFIDELDTSNQRILELEAKITELGEIIQKNLLMIENEAKKLRASPDLDASVKKLNDLLPAEHHVKANLKSMLDAIDTHPEIKESIKDDDFLNQLLALQDMTKELDATVTQNSRLQQELHELIIKQDDLLPKIEEKTTDSTKDTTQIKVYRDPMTTDITDFFKLKNTSTNNETLENEIKNLNIQHENVQRKITKLTDKLNGLKSQLESLESSLPKNEPDNSIDEEELGIMTGIEITIDEVRKKIKEVEKKLIEAKESQENVSKEIELKEQQRNQQPQIEELSRKLNLVSADNILLSNEVSELKEQEQIQSVQIKDLNTQDETLSSDNETLEKKIFELSEKISEIKATQQDNNKKITELEEQMNQLSSANETAKDPKKIEEIQLDIQNLKEKKAEIDQQLYENLDLLAAYVETERKQKTESEQLTDKKSFDEPASESLEPIKTESKTPSLEPSINISELAKNWNIKLFHIELSQSFHPSTDASGTTFNIQDPKTKDDVLKNGVLFTDAESQIPYTFYVDNDIPRAILKNEDCHCSSLEPTNDNQEALKRTTQCVTHIIDNILANSNTIDIKTDNPVIFAISQEYLRKLHDEGLNFNSTLNFTGNEMPIETPQLNKIQELITPIQIEAEVKSAIESHPQPKQDDAHSLTPLSAPALLNATWDHNNDPKQVATTTQMKTHIP